MGMETVFQFENISKELNTVLGFSAVPVTVGSKCEVTMVIGML